ncbi:MAG: DUF2336 domain-containing protein [Bradyrhizobium sp.]|uniref:DUF2336 domain-containing protein n=1 Tax=Bradyrhizobium sp. TaxID=376 RepID=UPI0025C323F6|nr:DUF2336 domain-containing protein [Bradyrhizobium sp.]MBI5260363.1 DUF2336 domain-containing protein [Bradyrhizobium sp.]
MLGQQSLLTELEETASRGTPESRLRALWHATDLLIAGTYSEEQIWIFGTVIDRLAHEIETVARAKLANKLATSRNAPLQVIERLALDDDIEIAGPVLMHSERVDVRTLIVSARSKGQPHLLAISKRRSVPTAVTNVLIVRGSGEVVGTLAANNGASFSEFGFLKLVQRSEGDSVIAEQLGLRRDIPRHVFQQLIAKASEEVRTKLERERPEMATEVGDVVTRLAGTIHAKFGPASKNYFAAKRIVAKLYESGGLDEDKVFEFAHSLKFNETAAALSLLCGLPAHVVERALIDKNREVVLILARAMTFSWQTTMALLFLGAHNCRITAGDLDRLQKDFLRLTVDNSRQVLALYRSRRELGSE